jgi:hypothetical protein
MLTKIEEHGGVVGEGGKEADEFCEGLACVSLAGKHGYIDEAGEYIIKPQSAEACEFSEGLAAVKVGSKWGYVDRSGRVVIEPQFDAPSIRGLGRFQNGLARVMIVTNNGKPVQKWGYINQKGKYIWKPTK